MAPAARGALAGDVAEDICSHRAEADGGEDKGTALKSAEVNRTLSFHIKRFGVSCQTNRSIVIPISAGASQAGHPCSQRSPGLSQ